MVEMLEAVEAAEPVVQEAGFHWVIVFPNCELAAPNSDSPAAMVGPLTPPIVSVPEVSVWSYLISDK